MDKYLWNDTLVVFGESKTIMTPENSILKATLIMLKKEAYECVHGHAHKNNAVVYVYMS